MTVWCTHCDCKFHSSAAFDRHWRSLHSDSVADLDYDGYEEDIAYDEAISCTFCRKCFPTDDDTFDHLQSCERRTWCAQCHRFQTRDSLEQHLRNGHDMLPCPFCKKSFRQPSAIAQHIESGGCRRAGRIPRHQITAAVHALRISPTISIPRRIEFPATSKATYKATELAYNAAKGAYECYLCHKTFARLVSLNDHLSSPAHDEAEFRCPQPACRRDFTVVSAIIQHIESETCGLAKFSEVERHTRALTDQFTRLLTL